MSLITPTIATDDPTQGKHKLGQHFMVSRTTDGEGVVNVDNVNADSIYLRDAEGGANNIQLSAETVNNLNDTVNENTNRLDTLLDAATTDLDTIVEIVAAFEAGDSTLQGNVTSLTQQQLTNTSVITTNVTDIAKNADDITAEAARAGAAEDANTALINTNITDIAKNVDDITAEAARAGAAEDANTALINTNAANIATNTTSIATYQATNVSGVANINRIVPGFTESDYGYMTPTSDPQILTGTNAMPDATPVNILLHLGPIWKLVCINNNANHITYLHLNDQQSTGSTLGHYQRATAVEISAVYT